MHTNFNQVLAVNFTWIGNSRWSPPQDLAFIIQKPQVICIQSVFFLRNYKHDWIQTVHEWSLDDPLQSWHWYVRKPLFVFIQYFASL